MRTPGCGYSTRTAAHNKELHEFRMGTLRRTIVVLQTGVLFRSIQRQQYAQVRASLRTLSYRAHRHLPCSILRAATETCEVHSVDPVSCCSYGTSTSTPSSSRDHPPKDAAVSGFGRDERTCLVTGRPLVRLLYQRENATGWVTPSESTSSPHKPQWWWQLSTNAACLGL